MDQSNKMESYLSKSQAKNSVSKVQAVVREKGSPKVKDAFKLCGKPSFIICKGRRIPDLIEVTSHMDTQDSVDPYQMKAGEGAILKIKSLVKRQGRIMSLVDWILNRKKEVSLRLSQDEDQQTDDSIGNDDISKFGMLKLDPVYMRAYSST